MTVRQRPSCDEDHISSTAISIGEPPVLAASATPPGSRLPLSISRKEPGLLGLSLVVVEDDRPAAPFRSGSIDEQGKPRRSCALQQIPPALWLKQPRLCLLLELFYHSKVASPARYWNLRRGSAPIDGVA